MIGDQEIGRPDPGGATENVQKQPENIQAPQAPQTAEQRVQDIVTSYGQPYPASEIPRATPFVDTPPSAVPRKASHKVILIWESGILTKFDADGRVIGPV